MDFPTCSPSGIINDSSQYLMGSSSNNETPQDRAKRRSSARSIKRRRFDDELVEYGRGVPGTSMSKMERRIRTLSYAGGQYVESVIPASIPPVTPPVSVAPGPEIIRRKMSSKPSSKRSRKRAHLSHLSTKDLGRWKPSDDLALIIGVMQTNDLKMVYRGVKFTCRFTLSELQSRWHALLYNAEVSRVAIAAMRNLHPDLVDAVRAKAPYSKAEEELLCTFPSTLTKNCTTPLLEKFQELLDQNPTVFFPARTAKHLKNYWMLMRHYQLLPDQTVQPLPKGIRFVILVNSFCQNSLTKKPCPYREKSSSICKLYQSFVARKR